MTFLKNTWYQAGWISELNDTPLLARTIAEQPIVIYRDSQNKPVAVHDQCSHRFAPLSAGRVQGDNIVCGYHGLAFAPNGRCSHNPHGAIPKRLCIKSYPIVERHSALWVWLGDADLADLCTIPNLDFIDQCPESARITGYMHTACDYQLLTDNILDLSHADYLHPDTLGGMMTQSETDLQTSADRVNVTWHAKNCQAPPAFLATADDNGRADISISVTWQPPAVMALTANSAPPGIDFGHHSEGNTLHNMVPETKGTTHYFYCSTRKFQLDNEAFTQFLTAAVTQAFTAEDKPMLEKQQLRIGQRDFLGMNPVILSIDAASSQARRKLQKIIDREQSTPNNATAY